MEWLKEVAAEYGVASIPPSMTLGTLFKFEQECKAKGLTPKDKEYHELWERLSSTTSADSSTGPGSSSEKSSSPECSPLVVQMPVTCDRRIDKQIFRQDIWNDSRRK